jgi:subtilisin family serine protease
MQERSEDAPYAGLIYVEGQVVLTGPSDDSIAVRTGLQLNLVPVARLDRGERGPRTELFKIEPIKSGELKTVEQVTCEINELSPRLRLTISADPNYYLSPAGWSGGGSPWTQNGGGWVEGIVGGGQAVDGTPTSAQFQRQWAFGTAGIDLASSTMQSQVVPERDVVRIGVFDTSPFTSTFPFEVIGWRDAEIESLGLAYEYAELPWSELMEDAADPLATGDLTVWHFDTIDADDWDTCPGKDLESQDLSNHGLFVSSLAHAVSPSSQIYLVRVLDEDACGSLLAIAQGIEMFMTDALLARERKDIDHIILNLSLGVHQPPNPTCYGLPEEVHALRLAINKAVENGATVVAAAGNDSYNRTPNAPEDMEIPAAYDNVIGVAASNSDRTRGCFSNADLDENTNTAAAPGGNGVPRDIVVHGSEGDQFLHVPCAVPNCLEDDTQCLIGVVYRDGIGYAYWVGTSFAAPLVSGQEALQLQVGAVAGPEQCASIDATLPNGIINLLSSSGGGCPALSVP